MAHINTGICSLKFNEEGDIVGRNQGIKGWLHDNAPILYDHELVDPERIEDATMLAEWKAKYTNEITLRTKSKWWRKLKEKVG